MDNKPYFKVWAAEALLSDDLDELTDHDRTVWLFLMCAAALENPRWSVKISPQLVKKCKSTPQKFSKSIERLEVLGMVSVQNNVLSFVNAAKWNEGTDRRKPSDTPERIRERVQKHRNAANVTPDVTRYTSDETPGVTPGNAAYKEEEKEEEKELEGVTPTPLRAARPKKGIEPCSDGDMAKLRAKWGNTTDFDAEVLAARNHTSREKNKSEYLYLDNWLRRSKPLPLGNGSAPHANGSVPPPHRWAMDDPSNAVNRGNARPREVTS